MGKTRKVNEFIVRIPKFGRCKRVSYLDTHSNKSIPITYQKLKATRFNELGECLGWCMYKNFVYGLPVQLVEV